MTVRPVSHTRSATWIKSNDWTSHQPYKKRHVDGMGRTLSFSLSQVSTKAEVKVNAKVRTTPKATLA